MHSEHENETIRTWVDGALSLLVSFDGWAALRAEMRTTVLLLEVEAEQLFTRTVDTGGSPDSLGEAGARTIATMAAHWWNVEGHVIRDVDDRR